MVVLLQLANGQGKCDSSCHNATKERCTCKVCGGLLHGIGQQQALEMRTKLLRELDQEERVGEQVPYWVDEQKRRQKQSVILVECQIGQKILRRLRAPARVKAQIAAGQLPLWPVIDHPVRQQTFARPRRRHL